MSVGQAAGLCEGAPGPLADGGADEAAPAHQPFIPSETDIPEFTWQAVAMGAVLGIIFGASSLYLVLKTGLTVSASIPIAVLSITLFRVLSRMCGVLGRLPGPLGWPFRVFGTRRATILENNIVQTTGSAGESIAFGVGVTMPALMILGFEMQMTRVMLVATLGGLLGILMMIPLRRAFIVKQHGKLRYPEGTACADVLIVGEKGGTTAATVFIGFGIAFGFKVLMQAVKLWKDIPSRMLGFFKGAEVSLEADPALLGVGYIIGPKIASVMVGGGVLASFVFVPLITIFGEGLGEPLYPGTHLIRDMSTYDIWKSYMLYIGAGAVAAGGIVSMVQALPMIGRSVAAGLRDLSAGGGAAAVRARLPRIERDMSMRVVVFGALGLVVAIWAAPLLNMNWRGALLIVLLGFLFVTVSSRLTGEIGSSSNPISGMTVATLLITSLVFLALGMTTRNDKLTALSIAGIVSIAASNGGTTSQDLKTGYLVGGTPRWQQIAILVGALTSALVIGGTLELLNDASTVYTTKNLPAVQADAAAVAAMRRERAGRPYADDTTEYGVWHVGEGEVEGLPQGRYLVDEGGAIRYLADPGINGVVKVDDRGQSVTKYDAPKAHLMALIIDGILSRKLPWSLVLLGVSVALVLELCGVPSLPFAVGVYLPLSASTPIFVGGAVRWVADRLSRRSEAESEMSPGVLLSSGYIAGGAIAGIVYALMAAFYEDAMRRLDLSGKLGAAATSEWLPVVMFGALTAVLLVVGVGRSRRVAHAA